MKKRFLFIAALAFSFVFPVALSGLGIPVGEAMAQNKRYSVEVHGEWSSKSPNPGWGGVSQTYESNALTPLGARTSAISQFKKDHPNYKKNVKAVATKEVKKSPGQKTIEKFPPLELRR